MRDCNMKTAFKRIVSNYIYSCKLTELLWLIICFRATIRLRNRNNTGFIIPEILQDPFLVLLLYDQ